MKKRPTPHKAASSAPDTAKFTAMARLLALRDTINTAVLRVWCASPSGWSRGTIRPGAEKHYGFGDPSISRRSSRAHFGQRLFYAHALRMAHMAYLFGGPCGDTRKGVPVPTAGSPTPHGLPPPFGDGEGRFQTCSDVAKWAQEQQAQHHQNPQPKKAENRTQQAQAAIKDEAPKPARRTVNTSAQHIQ